MSHFLTENKFVRLTYSIAKVQLENLMVNINIQKNSACKAEIGAVLKSL